ncbi:YncE family protein [Solibacillus sp. FSL H8-0523]|uniref:YncE family protein n=1 Tax=Solibacillus sp. FSL H8-0523 TaxID=2954511 RepID=UPI0031019B01
MNYIRMIILISSMLLLVACNETAFQAIDDQQDFIASVNILEPSVTFYDEENELMATWDLDKAYTGALLFGQDALLLYGHQLEQAELYELSTGKQIEKFNTGIGVTNALYDEHHQLIYVTNSKTNELTSFSITGDMQNKVKLRNYPMSMTQHENLLYVVNYKDTLLSVVDTATFTVKQEWPIESSSQGIAIIEKTGELWLGGHGQGSKSNDQVQVLDLVTGVVKKQIKVPLMPVTLLQSSDEVVVASHGSNMIYTVSTQGTITWQQEIAANPFAVAYFQGQLVVAGYDDQTLYFINDDQVTEHVVTGKGAFQLLVRERAS